MRQKSIGEVLRTAREGRGWTFVDLQRITKIQAKYLQALEYNDFDFIANSDDVHSILRAYAEALELDADVLLDAYETNSLVKYYEDGEEELRSSELKRSYKVRKRKKNSYLPLIYLLLATGLIIIFVTYIVHSRLQNRASITPTTTSYSIVEQSVSEASSGTETSSTEQAQSNSTSSSSSATENVTISGSGSNIVATLKTVTYPVEVTVTAKNTTSWISLSDTLLEGGVTLTPDNPTVTTTIEEGVTSTTLVLGVVKGVEVSVGGQKLDISALTADTGSVTLNFE
ncbi:MULTISPECIES: cytoskeleton protein RodZ [Streptococcus]|uniref:Helix-turn-helix domain-containing protein n=1 Tax=Streptococcus suis TaxID=1307 RepID=A0A123UY83_STRSU|nr:cytoskeleton protein RodZ [Streptococcus suis]AGL48887.1 Transcriptional regulator in cluster with unspecified monosaccharide ABC transport system [Streptococcus suis TL13]MBO3642240.1 helix-turn-helix domain-containing protein [Streptococcus suis]MBY5025323.1 helix-turn-helix domain-containing protein [Streptococcus suis]MDG4527927.1 helix-turn-helix domain-containing protein [Streptococcus suis]MDG4529947.1 helix-turn-helix domain-containing protein [Streptococcus suis]